MKVSRERGRTILTEAESKEVLRALRDSDGCHDDRGDRSRRPRRPAGQIGYPVVLKLYSETITHKTDVGGVQLNLGDRAGRRRQAFGAIQIR